MQPYEVGLLMRYSVSKHSSTLLILLELPTTVCFHCSDKTDRKAKSPKRSSIGRGGKLLAISRSYSSTDSDTEETKSQPMHSVSNERTVEPCELPLNNKLVAITSVISHTIVYLRSIEMKDNERYLKYLNDVAESSKTATSFKEMPKKGDIVLADFDGVYYRALVARIVSDTVVVVAFLEFGNLETKPVDTLKKLRDDLKYVKRFTFKAKFSDLNEGLKSDKCVNYLHQLLKKKIPLKFIRKDDDSLPGVVPCQLFVSTTNESVTGKLKALNNLTVDRSMVVQESVISTANNIWRFLIFHFCSLAAHSKQTIGRKFYRYESSRNRQYIGQ